MRVLTVIRLLKLMSLDSCGHVQPSTLTIQIINSVYKHLLFPFYQIYRPICIWRGNLPIQIAGFFSKKNDDISSCLLGLTLYSNILCTGSLCVLWQLTRRPYLGLESSFFSQIIPDALKAVARQNVFALP